MTEVKSPCDLWHRDRQEVKHQGLFFWLFWVCCCPQAFCVVASRGYSPAVMCRLLIAAASLVVKPGLWVHRLSSCGLQAQLSCGVCSLPGPEIDPVSPASAGRFFTTGPPGKSPNTEVSCTKLRDPNRLALVGLEYCLWNIHLQESMG